MAAITRVEEIQAWQKARNLVREIYRLSADGLFARDFGLRDQLRRASVSIMANIAEGFGRGSDKEFARFLDIARGSAVEAQTLLYVACDAGYINEKEFSGLYANLDETILLIAGFTTYLRKQPPDGQ